MFSLALPALGFMIIGASLAIIVKTIEPSDAEQGSRAEVRRGAYEHILSACQSLDIA